MKINKNIFYDHRFLLKKKSFRDSLILLCKRKIRNLLKITKKKTVRDSKTVNYKYEEIYDLSNEKWISFRNKRNDSFNYSFHISIFSGWYVYFLHNNFIKDLVNQTSSQKILEVGSGRGQNCILQILFNNKINITGIEYSQKGVARSKELLKNIPEIFFEISNIKTNVFEKKEINQKINFVSGDATNMPFKDKSFDLSFTNLVLEQMPYDYEKVLNEMVRVTRNYCIFIEPFYDQNSNEGLDYLKSQDYFRFKYDNFKIFNLEPIFYTTDFPQRLKFKVGLLFTKIKN